MRKIQTFRVTTDLKSGLTEFCLENDLHNSAVLRQALAKIPQGADGGGTARLIVKHRADMGAHHR